MLSASTSACQTDASVYIAAGVAFYFPAMKERAASKKANSTLEQTWGVPFAVAPFYGYGKNVVPALNREFPAYVPEGSNNSSVVFHQMSGNQGFKDDLSLKFRDMIETYVNHHHSGMVPNPWVLGIGELEV